MTDLERIERADERCIVMKEAFRLGKASVYASKDCVEMRMLLEACDPSDVDVALDMFKFSQDLAHESTLAEVNRKRGFEATK